MKVGHIIAKGREEKGWTQSKLADTTGMSLEWVKQVEGGRTRKPRDESLKKVAEALGLSYSEMNLAIEAEEDAQRVAPSEERSKLMFDAFMAMQRLPMQRLRDMDAIIQAFLEMDEEGEPCHVEQPEVSV